MPKERGSVERARSERALNLPMRKGRWGDCGSRR